MSANQMSSYSFFSFDQVSALLQENKKINELIFVVQEYWGKQLCRLLCSQMKRRKQLQKAEFITAWIFLLFIALTRAGVAAGSSTTSGTPGSALFFLFSGMDNLAVDGKGYGSFEQLSSFYFRVTLFTRLIAYAIDFANAREKLGKLPSWLVLHHSGVFIFHILVAFEFSQSDTTKVMLYLLGFQSTHNTWTKRYSLTLYWGNVFVGTLVSIVFTLMNIFGDKEVSLSNEAYFCCLLAPIMAYTGVGLLKAECSRDKVKTSRRSKEAKNENNTTA